jgi:hypothetical protein
VLRPPSRTIVVLVRGDVAVACWPLGDAAAVVALPCAALPAAPLDAERVDLSVIDELARLQLAARRLGYSIDLAPSGPLAELLALTGLSSILAEGAALSIIEVGGESESSEEIGVEEAVDGADPAV